MTSLTIKFITYICEFNVSLCLTHNVSCNGQNRRNIQNRLTIHFNHIKYPLFIWYFLWYCPVTAYCGYVSTNYAKNASLIIVFDASFCPHVCTGRLDTSDKFGVWDNTSKKFTAVWQVFVGILSNQSSWLIYFPQSGKILTSTDIVLPIQSAPLQLKSTICHLTILISTE